MCLFGLAFEPAAHARRIFEEQRGARVTVGDDESRRRPKVAEPVRLELQQLVDDDAARPHLREVVRLDDEQDARVRVGARFEVEGVADGGPVAKHHIGDVLDGVVPKQRQQTLRPHVGQ